MPSLRGSTIDHYHAYGKLGDFIRVKRVLKYMNKHGYPPSVISYTALMEAYGTAGQYNQAEPTSKEEIFSRGIQIHAEKHKKHLVLDRNEKALTPKGTVSPSLLIFLLLVVVASLRERNRRTKNPRIQAYFQRVYKRYDRSFPFWKHGGFQEWL
ncbi:hypothetical protein MRB53_016015 [Persea americana]|uniref:Uncharacterized protein n=1 Tax=Persea americana TaxID=3435 RepID=A0ACC2M1W9_PERAE|nr:hypothetical protein MRB53_016015 [Persea americana]